jgi:hypothetical protein
MDGVFMTTNLSVDQIKAILEQENIKDVNIRITVTVDSKVEFLDAIIENHLKTSVFHIHADEILPYYSGHPRQLHSNAIKGALFRAARLCSNVEEFNRERLHIELTLLLNDYPPKFIAYHLNSFFKTNAIDSTLIHAYPETYLRFHRALLQKPTRREMRHNISLRHDQPVGRNTKEIRVPFTFETGPSLCLAREIHRLWKQHYCYHGSPMNDIRLLMIKRTRKTLEQWLIRKKPQ